MQWFYNLKLGNKHIISFVFVAILTGIAGTLAILNLNTINKDYKKMYVSNITSIKDSFQISDKEFGKY